MPVRSWMNASTVSRVRTSGASCLHLHPYALAQLSGRDAEDWAVPGGILDWFEILRKQSLMAPVRRMASTLALFVAILIALLMSPPSWWTVRAPRPSPIISPCAS